MSDELLSTVGAAAIAECHRATIFRAVVNGILPGIQAGRGYIIRRSDLDKWIAAGKPTKPPEQKTPTGKKRQNT
jgi:excisionase family DNA binding protein